MFKQNKLEQRGLVQVLWNYWSIHSLWPLFSESGWTDFFFSLSLSRLVGRRNSSQAWPMAWPQARLCLRINIKSRSGQEAGKECEANKANDVCSHVFCLSSVQKNVKRKVEHIISFSTANKADHQHKVTHTLAAPTEDRNTFRLGTRREGESFNYGCWASLREIGHVVRVSGTVCCPPLDGTRAFGRLAGSESAAGNRGAEQQPRVTAFSAPALRWIYSIFNWQLLHLFNSIESMNHSFIHFLMCFAVNTQSQNASPLILLAFNAARNIQYIFICLPMNNIFCLRHLFCNVFPQINLHAYFEQRGVLFLNTYRFIIRMSIRSNLIFPNRRIKANYWLWV